MSLFRWAAPLCKLFGRRWSEDDFQTLASYLRPQVPEGGIFLDIGGGTGDLGAGVAQALNARVVVLDNIAQMLRRVDARPLVSVCLASVEELPFPDNFFDGALCCDAFHHFRHQALAVGEITRVVRPGGGILILEMEGNRLRDKPWVALEKILGEPAALHTAPSLRRFLTAHGIEGTVALHRGSSYIFSGIVAQPLVPD